MNVKSLLEQHKALMVGRWLTDLSNTSAFIFSEIKDINWVGFYLFESKNQTLELGPFQGKPACTDIKLGRGVCGKAAQNREVLVVPNVHEFTDHIVCDSASNSEIVVPIVYDHHLIGVLDVDSASLNRFSEVEREFFIGVVNQLKFSFKT